jgi:[ribosomal protein S18]-alanine N-acetyltransferase
VSASVGSSPRSEASGDPSNSPILIRPARAADLPRVLEVERAAYSSPWSGAAFESLLPRDGQGVYFRVGLLEGRVVGHGILWMVEDEAELANLAVEPGSRRRGVARRLLDHLLDEAVRSGVGRVFLEVRVSNEGAQDLYLSRGFELVGHRRNYYRNPLEDAQILRLDLTRT